MNAPDAAVHASESASAIGRATSPPLAEQAYRRSDALEKRRKLMDQWPHIAQRHKLAWPLRFGSSAGQG